MKVPIDDGRKRDEVLQTNMTNFASEKGSPWNIQTDIQEETEPATDECLILGPPTPIGQSPQRRLLEQIILPDRAKIIEILWEAASLSFIRRRRQQRRPGTSNLLSSFGANGISGFD